MWSNVHYKTNCQIMCSCKYLGNGKVLFENYRDYYKDVRVNKDNTNKEGGTDEENI